LKNVAETFRYLRGRLKQKFPNKCDYSNADRARSPLELNFGFEFKLLSTEHSNVAYDKVCSISSLASFICFLIGYVSITCYIL